MGQKQPHPSLLRILGRKIAPPPQNSRMAGSSCPIGAKQFRSSSWEGKIAISNLAKTQPTDIRKACHQGEASITQSPSPRELTSPRHTKKPFPRWKPDSPNFQHQKDFPQVQHHSSFMEG